MQTDNYVSGTGYFLAVLLNLVPDKLTKTSLTTLAIPQTNPPSTKPGSTKSSCDETTSHRRVLAENWVILGRILEI
jgi:hypothetical protein